MTLAYCRRISSLGLDALGPVHDHPGVVAAAVRHRDRPRGRSRPGHGPAHRVVRVGVRSAVLVEARKQIRHVFWGVVGLGPLDERAIQIADDRSAVVAEDVEDERVVEFADFLDAVDQAADFVVRVLRQRRIHFHLPGKDLLLIGREVLPFLHRFRVRRELGARRHDAHLDLPLEDLFAHGVPSLVELALVEILLQPARRRRVRRMAGALRVVHHEGPVGRQGSRGLNPVDGLVRQVGVEVIVRGPWECR